MSQTQPASGRKTSWFISDLHLAASRPQVITLLHQFLDFIQPQAEALYILGDLFEFWVGDDVIHHPRGRAYLPVIEHLRSLSDSGIKLYFMQGNRDFLVRQTLMQQTGARLLPDVHVINLYGTPTLLLHGDTLCTDDKNYQRMRWLFRQRWLQALYLSLSVEKRSKQSGDVRQATRQQLRKKADYILDVNPQAVAQLMRDKGVLQMIHGHTHRPARHEFELEGQTAVRYVLGDWHDKASYLRADAGGLELVY